MCLGDRIKQARKAANLTQEQLAQKCGVATITIRQYEAGKREPRYEQLRTIADALDVTTGYLQGYESIEAKQIVEALHQKDARKLERLMGMPAGTILSTSDTDGLQQEKAIIDQVFQAIKSSNGKSSKLSDSDAQKAGFLQFNSDSDRIAFFYSRLNIDGKLAASQHFFKHLDPTTVKDVANFVQSLSEDPQYQRKSESSEDK